MSKMPKSFRFADYRVGGFTLIELMVTVAIVAILASIAYPSYRRQVMRTNRSEGLATMLKASQQLESCSTTRDTYVGCPQLAAESPNKFYKMTYTLAQATYVVKAEAQGAQANDEKCVSFELNQLSVKTSKDSANNDSTSECWR